MGTEQIILGLIVAGAVAYFLYKKIKEKAYNDGVNYGSKPLPTPDDEKGPRHKSG